MMMMTNGRIADDDASNHQPKRARSIEVTDTSGSSSGGGIAATTTTGPSSSSASTSTTTPTTMTTYATTPLQRGWVVMDVNDDTGRVLR